MLPDAPYDGVKIIDDTTTDHTLLLEQARALVAGERDPVAVAANLSALLYASLDDVNWAGFYFHRDGELIVGPFQGLPACVHIPLGKGVCGTAAAERRSLIVDDVHAFAGHIACDAASNAELVVPLVDGDELLGVIDIDSPRHGRFHAQDRELLEAIAALYVDTVCR
ncbi:MAG: GAF domain-containing protein [Pseudomonadota bacterium]